MEILPDTKFAKLNANQYNDNFTENLINKAKIITIKHKLSKQQINQLDGFYFQSGLGRKYGSVTINQIVEDNNFDPDKKNMTITMKFQVVLKFINLMKAHIIVKFQHNIQANGLVLINQLVYCISNLI